MSEQLLEDGIHQAILGLNVLRPADVQVVSLSDVEVDGVGKRGEAELTVSLEDATLALNIARAIVELLVQLEYRILDAVVPASGAAMFSPDHREHDVVGEWMGADRLILHRSEMQKH